MSKWIPKIKKFDPEGSGYDYLSAAKAGLKRDDSGHFPSREPKTGLLLKGKKHPTWHKTVEAEKKLGYTIYKKGNRYYSSKFSKTEKEVRAKAKQAIKEYF